MAALELNLTTRSTAPFADYMPASDVYDEYCSSAGTVRPCWSSIVETLDELGPAGLETSVGEIQRLVRESSANFQVSSIAQHSSRPWQLAAVPLAIDARQWSVLEERLKQRVRLLEAVLSDLLGPQRLLKERVLPAELLSANPEFARVYHELPASGIRLNFTATDLARNKDGSWWVTGDRTRAPSGLGYALENRIITSRVFPHLIRRSNVIRFASFFTSLQRRLNSLAIRNRENPRVAILTPGQSSYRYVEDAYLARYLGYTLVQGRDLAVRGDRLHLKTLGGLLPIEVLWRHVSDRKCDPLELNPNSEQGVTGLLQTIRTGNVAVANSIGSVVAQMPALLPFLPAASKFLFGEEPSLPSIATYWCGGAKERAFVLSHLDELVIRPAFAISARPPIEPAELSAENRAKLIADIQRSPHQFVAQQRPSRSITPVWHDGELQSWHLALRSFQVQVDGDVEVLPGGLARVSPNSKSLDHSPTSGRLGLDCWIVSDKPVDQETTLLSSSKSSIKLTRSGAELPSRVAENLFWLGRSAERTESISRLMRVTLTRIAGESEVKEMPEISRLIAALAAAGQIEPDHAIEEFGANLPSLEAVLPNSLYDEDKPRGIRAGLMDMNEKASAVHDRISLDAYRVITKIGEHLVLPIGESHDAGATINRLDRVITDLQAFSGLAAESMTRTHGWRFLQLGRRIERAFQACELLSATLVNPIVDEQFVLESILQTTDSLMTYRSRYLLHMHPVAVVDLLVNDETNPRSIVFQLEAIVQFLDQLPTDDSEIDLGPDQKLAHDLLHVVRMSDAMELSIFDKKGLREELDVLLQKLIVGLPKLSDAITARYLIHTSVTQELTGRVDSLVPRLETS